VLRWQMIRTDNLSSLYRALNQVAVPPTNEN
jgi:hypothetical protein